MKIERLPVRRPTSYGQTIAEIIKADGRNRRFQRDAEDDATNYTLDSDRRLSKAVSDLRANAALVEASFLSELSLAERNIDRVAGSAIGQAMLAKALAQHAELNQSVFERFRD